MIDQLLRDMLAATAASRELDVRLHEAMTAELDMCKDEPTRAACRERGRILREKGGELLWYDVLPYTSNAHFVIEVLMAWGLAVRLTTATPAMIEQAAAQGQSAKRFHMSVADQHGRLMAFVQHDASPALCAAALVLKFQKRPKDAINCAACAEPFVPSGELKEAIGALPPSTNFLAMCVPCSLMAGEAQGNG